MLESNTDHNNDPHGENTDQVQDVFHSVDSISNQLSSIETFIARRFDELSMEINATSQQVDLAEEGITRRFSEILSILHAVSFSGDGDSPANAGVELDAVVEMTEKAANRILDAADRIASRVHKDLTESGGTVDEIDKDIEEIFLACSFQDITGQRIRKTLENLKSIEDRLGTALDKMGIEIDTDVMPDVPKAQSQDDVDAMFSTNKNTD